MLVRGEKGLVLFLQLEASDLICAAQILDLIEL